MTVLSLCRAAKCMTGNKTVTVGKDLSCTVSAVGYFSLLLSSFAFKVNGGPVADHCSGAPL